MDLSGVPTKQLVEELRSRQETTSVEANSCVMYEIFIDDVLEYEGYTDAVILVIPV